MRNTGQSAGKRCDKWQGQQKDIRKTQRRKFLGFRYVYRTGRNKGLLTSEYQSGTDAAIYEKTA